MPLRPVGYEFKPRKRYESDLSDFMNSGGWTGDDTTGPPTRATMICSDERGDSYVGLPHGDGVIAMPFIPGSPAEIVGGAIGDHGGFVPIDKMPSGVGAGGFDDMLGGMAGQLPTQAANWLGKAAAQAMFSGAPGGVMDSVLGTLGIKNPLASGPIGAAMGSALGAAGLGPAGSMLGGLISGGGAGGLAQSVGSAGLGSLLSSSGLGNIPGMGALGSIAGGQAGGALADIIGGGCFGGPLDTASVALGGCFPAGDTGTDAMEGIMNGGCFGGGGNELAAAASGIGADALNSAADQMLSQWQVDDESSAAEHIAHKAVNDNKDKIKEAVLDPDGFMKKINGFFSGEAPGTGMPAVRITDLDDGADLSTMGVANILFESMPVSRITDMVVGPKSPAPKPILEGAATVLSAELPTAFVSGKTAVPSVLVKGAPTILVGGAIASISPPDSATGPSVATNGGPTGPKAPSAPDTGSASAGAAKPGNTAEAASAGNSGQGGTKAAVDDSSFLADLGDIAGKLWAAPNTAVGLVYGGFGHVLGEIGNVFDLCDDPDFAFNNNALEFYNNPLMGSAMTFGNVIVYGQGISPDQLNFVPYYVNGVQVGTINRDGYTVGDEERNHTYQAQILGPLYFPFHLAGMTTGTVAGMINEGRWNPSEWAHHGEYSFGEAGPQTGSVFFGSLSKPAQSGDVVGLPRGTIMLDPLPPGVIGPLNRYSGGNSDPTRNYPTVKHDAIAQLPSGDRISLPAETGYGYIESAK